MAIIGSFEIGKIKPMDATLSFNNRLYFTGIVSLAIWSLLAWNYFHGGIPIHHILARKDLPAFSNAWGGLSLPLLTWFLLYRIQKRNLHQSKSITGNISPDVIYGFISALSIGILFSVLFTLGFGDVLGYVMLILFSLGLFVPIYRSEYLLGFVIGMSYTFGAILPMIIGSILLLVALIMNRVVRPFVLFVASQTTVWVNGMIKK